MYGRASCNSTPSIIALACSADWPGVCAVDDAVAISAGVTDMFDVWVNWATKNKLWTIIAVRRRAPQGAPSTPHGTPMPPCEQTETTLEQSFCAAHRAVGSLHDGRRG